MAVASFECGRNNAFRLARRDFVDAKSYCGQRVTRVQRMWCECVSHSAPKRAEWLTCKEASEYKSTTCDREISWIPLLADKAIGQTASQTVDVVWWLQLQCNSMHQLDVAHDASLAPAAF